MEEADIVVTVVGTTQWDFNAAQQIIRAGYEAAAANQAKLSWLTVDEVTWQQYLAQRDGRLREGKGPAVRHSHRSASGDGHSHHRRFRGWLVSLLIPPSWTKIFGI